MRILFLSRWFPYPADNGSKMRIKNLLEALAKQHDVTLLSFTDNQNGSKEDLAPHPLYHEIQTIPWNPYEPDSSRARLGFFSLTPRSLVDTFSPEMKDAIERKLSNETYNLVIASELGMASYSPHFQAVPALFEDVELGLFVEPYTQAKSIGSRLRNGLTWGKLRYYLSRLMRNFDAFTVVSDKELRFLGQFVARDQSIELVPNCIDLRKYQGFNNETAQTNTIIFTGSFGFDVNYDAMNWFLSDIYPHVRERRPDINLVITGDHKNLPMPNLDNVNLTGFVEDVRPLIARACLSIAPLRIGGGTRIKILEAMALQTPVVATTKGAEGLEVQHGQHLLIADTPTDFSEAVLRLLTDPPLRRQLAANAYQLIEAKHDWESVLPDFLHLVEKVAAA